MLIRKLVNGTGTYPTSTQRQFMVPLLQIEFVKLIFENQVAGTNCRGWCVGTTDCGRAGFGTLGLGRMEQTHEEDTVPQRVEHLLCYDLLKKMWLIREGVYTRRLRKE